MIVTNVCFTFLLLLHIPISVNGLQCVSCQDVVDEALCTSTQTCTQGQQCGVDVSTIIGRDISNISRRQSPICKECCSTDSCNIDLCRHQKLDGQWSTWSDWTQCVVTCDNGTVSRQRTCSNPAPSGGGLNCTGQSSQIKQCFTATPCPVNGKWSEWSHWDSCSTSCEAGIQTRTRTCTNPKPDHQGDHCFGPNVDARLCDEGPCADGGWSSWSTWSTCTNKCGNGIKTQSRSCTNPVPSPHGHDCVGDPIRVDTCTDTTDCGLDYIHELASNNANELRIDLTAANDTTAYEVFEHFSLSPGPDYTLHVGNTLSSHNIGSMNRFGPYHNGYSFSTYDHDVDHRSGSNCASVYHGGWWYYNCYAANLNGQYLTPGSTDEKGIMYDSFLYHSSMKQTKMAFRRTMI
ncbi:Hemicentin-1 [Mactra antiquata]